MEGELMGIALSGGSSVVRGAHTVRLAGDKLASVEACWDNQSFYSDLGIKGPLSTSPPADDRSRRADT